MSPEQGVFGKSLRWTEFGTNDDEECPLAALGADGESWKTLQLRAAAKMAFLSRGASEQIGRAMIRGAPAALDELTAGMRGAIARESPGRYYIGWRARVLPVSKDQLRMATAEEAAAADVFLGKEA